MRKRAGSLSPSSSDNHANFRLPILDCGLEIACLFADDAQSALSNLQSSIHLLTSVVLPKPAGAEISITPGLRCKPSFKRSIRRGRRTTFSRGRGIYSLVARIGEDTNQL